MIKYPKRILLATGGSEDSVRALEDAVALADNASAELHLAHVGHAAPSSASAAGTAPALPGEPHGYTERQARKLLDGQAKVARAAAEPPRRTTEDGATSPRGRLPCLRARDGPARSP